MRMLLCVLILSVAVSSDAVSENLGAVQQSRYPDIYLKEDDNPKAPVDYGYGPGAGIPKAVAPSAVAPSAASAAAIPNGGAEAGAKGFFAAPATWPIIPIHMVLLSDGRVLSYGTDLTGAQGAQMNYDVWDPTLGTGSDAHLTLPNGTSTDIFCGSQSLIGSDFESWTTYKNSGDVLLSGGDLTVNGVRNYANNKTSIFYAKDDVLSSAGTMKFPRWYASFVPLRNGDKLIIGGRLNKDTLSRAAVAVTPEIYHVNLGWRTLAGIDIGDAIEYYYPRVFLGVDSALYFLKGDGHLLRLTTSGPGTMEDKGIIAAQGTAYRPTVMFSPGKLLSIRNNKRVQVIDLTKSPPTATDVASTSTDRIWSNGTVLPDGKVLVTGGSSSENVLTGVAYNAEIWDPKTSQWTFGAAAAKARLYHSAAVLLANGAVLTGGGGAPGPTKQLNAEIYYPPYLYRQDGSGEPAPRPTILSAPEIVKGGGYFTVTLGANEPISKVAIVHTGSATHSSDLEQRHLFLPFTQAGNTLTVRMSQNPNNTPPGYYMLFVFNSAGVPSVAKIVSLPRSVL